MKLSCIVYVYSISVYAVWWWSGRISRVFDLYTTYVLVH